MGLFFKSDEEKRQEEIHKVNNRAAPYLRAGNYMEAVKVYINYISNENYYATWAWNAAAWYSYLGGSVHYGTLEMADFAVCHSRYKDWNYLDTKACILWELGRSQEALYIWKDAIEEMGNHKHKETIDAVRHRINSIFVSYPFSENLIIPTMNKANDLLGTGFRVVTAKAVENTPLKDKIYSKILSSYYFVSVMSRRKQFTDGTYSTSPFILDEVSYALNNGREYFLLIEEGVNLNELPSYWLHGKHEFVTYRPDKLFEAMAEVLNALKISRVNLIKEVTGSSY